MLMLSQLVISWTVFIQVRFLLSFVLNLVKIQLDKLAFFKTPDQYLQHVWISLCLASAPVASVIAV